MDSMTCPQCGRNKARRACPALGQDICTVCCGTKRLVEIRCPDTCLHLSAARQHPPAVVQRQQARDAVALIPVVRELTRGQQELLFLLFGLVGQESRDPLQPLRDDDVADAAAALAATYETAARGVIYEHRPQSLPAQQLMAAVQQVFGKIAGESGRVFEAQDAPRSLRALEQAARSASGALGDPRATAFIELAARVIAPMARVADERDQEPDIQGGGRGASLIIPGA
jgi:hypothetical protein